MLHHFWSCILLEVMLLCFHPAPVYICANHQTSLRIPNSIHRGDSRSHSTLLSVCSDRPSKKVGRHSANLRFGTAIFTSGTKLVSSAHFLQQLSTTNPKPRISLHSLLLFHTSASSLFKSARLHLGYSSASSWQLILPCYFCLRWAELTHCCNGSSTSSPTDKATDASFTRS